MPFYMHMVVVTILSESSKPPIWRKPDGTFKMTGDFEVLDVESHEPVQVGSDEVRRAKE